MGWLPQRRCVTPVLYICLHVKTRFLPACYLSQGWQEPMSKKGLLQAQGVVDGTEKASIASLTGHFTEV